MHSLTGCSVARLSRLLWEQEAAGSNPATPTKSFSIFEEDFFVLYTLIAQMIVESVWRKKNIFSWQQRTTNGSSFAGIRKKNFESNLEIYSWNSSKKKLTILKKLSIFTIRKH